MDFTPGRAQNWCIDPYGTHEARWFSDGSPTSLVRDAGSTATDPMPETPFAREPVLIDPAPSEAGDDLRRADDRPDDPDAVVDAVWTYFTRSSGGL